MNNSDVDNKEHDLSLSYETAIDRLCSSFEKQWHNGFNPN